MNDPDLVAELRRSFAAALSADDAPTARGRLLEAGWLDVLEADEPLALSVVFRLQGSTLRDAAAVDDVIAFHLAQAAPQAAGDVAVAHPVPSGDATLPTHVVLAAHADATSLLWVDDLSGKGLSVIELATPLADRVGGIDPEFGLVAVAGRPAGSAVALDASAAADGWVAGLAAGRVAVAHQMNSGTKAMLDMATQYAKDRKQFGTPIASFQAVKHKLVDVLIALAQADAAASAWSSRPTEVGAVMAKVLAGRAAAVGGKNCLQVFGGIGFTSEHDFHPYYRRNIVLDRLLGDSAALERDLGRRLRAGELRTEHFIDLDDLPCIDLLPVAPLTS